MLLVSSCSVIKPKVKCSNGQETDDIKKCQEEIEKVAERFARFWEQKDYTSMYGMFIPELQKIKTKENFKKTLQYEEKENNIVVRLDKISKENETIAYIYYTVTSSLFDSKMPAMKIEYIAGDWKINGFSPYFIEDMLQAKYFLMQKSDLSSEYQLVKEDKIDEEITKKDIENQLKSKSIVEYKLFGKDTEQNMFIERVEIYSHEAIDKNFENWKELYKKLVSSSDPSLSYSYYKTPIIGEETIAVKMNLQHVQQLYYLTYKYKNLLVFLTLETDKNPEDKIIEFALISFNKIKDYESSQI